MKEQELVDRVAGLLGEHGVHEQVLVAGFFNPRARLVAYNTATGARGVLARFDPDLFGADSANLVTLDEESSGIIDAEQVIGPGWFLFNAQVHERSQDPDNVELGQLLAMKVDSFRDIYDIP